VDSAIASGQVSDLGQIGGWSGRGDDQRAQLAARSAQAQPVGGDQRRRPDGREPPAIRVTDDHGAGAVPPRPRASGALDLRPVAGLQRGAERRVLAELGGRPARRVTVVAVDGQSRLEPGGEPGMPGFLS